jgi:hypothetical protein
MGMCACDAILEFFKTLKVRTCPENGIIFLPPVEGSRHRIALSPVVKENATVKFICSCSNEILDFFTFAQRRE